MAAQDFNNDRKDGGEMGAGHTVTVLYEVVPAWVDERNGEPMGGRPQVDPLKYQVQPQIVLPPAPRTDSALAGEWLTVKARYKAPEGEVSDLLVRPVKGAGRGESRFRVSDRGVRSVCCNPIETPWRGMSWDDA
jgi:Ca-activated chloride channel family protein